jgi:hypothetical protein
LEQTAKRVGIDRFKKGRITYDERDGYSQGYICPLEIGGLGTLPYSTVYVTKDEYNFCNTLV